MSILSTLKKVGKAVTKPAVIIAAAISSPISYVKDPVKTVDKFIDQPITTQFVKGALAGATLGAAAGGGTGVKALASASKAALGTTAGKIVAVGATAAIVAPKTTDIVAKSPDLRDVAIGTAVGGPVLGGAVALEKGASIIGSAVEAYGPDIETALKIAGVGLGGAALTAGGIALASSLGNGGVSKEATIGGTEAQIPSTTQMATISTGTKRKRRKVKAPIIPSIRQNVKVIVSNSAVGSQITNKRYLNQRILA